MPEALPDLYVSADIETDGPIPGEYSMLSFAFPLASRFDGTTFEPYEPSWDTTFYVELKPISENFKQDALDVNGLDREGLAVSGRAPEDAMREAAEWVAAQANGRAAGPGPLPALLRLVVSALVLHPLHGRIAVRPLVVPRHPHAVLGAGADDVRPGRPASMPPSSTRRGRTRTTLRMMRRSRRSCSTGCLLGRLNGRPDDLLSQHLLSALDLPVDKG